jgi:hypothetical protein
VPHYVFEKRLIFFEEVMKHFILFWRNHEALWPATSLSLI